MTDFKYLIKDELDALSEKIAKQNDFIASDTYRRIDQRDRKLLTRQLRHMLAYRYVLAERFVLYKARMGEPE